MICNKQERVAESTKGKCDISKLTRYSLDESLRRETELPKCVFKLRLKYKEGVMVQRFVVIFNHHYLGGGPMEDDKE